MVIAIAGDLPQEAFVREAMIQTLTSAGVRMDDTVFVRSQSEIKGTETPDASQESASKKPVARSSRLENNQAQFEKVLVRT